MPILRRVLTVQELHAIVVCFWLVLCVLCYVLRGAVVRGAWWSVLSIEPPCLCGHEYGCIVRVRVLYHLLILVLSKYMNERHWKYLCRTDRVCLAGGQSLSVSQVSKPSPRWHDFYEV